MAVVVDRPDLRVWAECRRADGAPDRRGGGWGHAGGDWYHAIVLRNGDVALTVGDIVGHDAAASSRVARLRSQLDAHLRAPLPSPAEAIRRLDHQLAQDGRDEPGPPRPGRVRDRSRGHDVALGGSSEGLTEGLTEDLTEGLTVGVTATVVVALLSTRTGDLGPSGRIEVRWSSAGHPPPVVLRADGKVVIPTPRSDLMLGVAADLERSDHRFALEPGDRLMLYTDGLIERRGDHIDIGLTRLAQLARQHVTAAQPELAVLNAAVGPEPGDDVVLLIAEARRP